MRKEYHEFFFKNIFFFHRGKLIESRISFFFLLEDIRIDERNPDDRIPFFFFIVADIKIEGKNLFFITVK